VLAAPAAPAASISAAQASDTAQTAILVVKRALVVAIIGGTLPSYTLPVSRQPAARAFE